MTNNLIPIILGTAVISILIYNFFDKSRLFSHEMDVMDHKFLGFYICLVGGIVSIVLGIDIITGFLAALIMMQGRDLYRTDTNDAKTKKEEAK